MLEVSNNAKDESFGKRLVPFSRELYVEQEDFMEVPIKKYFRLFPGNEVRLMGAYFVKCNEVIKDEMVMLLKFTVLMILKLRVVLDLQEEKLKELFTG